MYAQNNAENQTDFQASRSSGYFELTIQSINQYRTTFRRTNIDRILLQNTLSKKTARN